MVCFRNYDSDTMTPERQLIHNSSENPSRHVCRDAFSPRPAVLRWSPEDGPRPAMWAVRRSDNLWLTARGRWSPHATHAAVWDIRAAADAAADLFEGAVVDLEAEAPPLHPEPEAGEVDRDRLKRWIRNHAARRRKARDADMPPLPRTMSPDQAAAITGSASSARPGPVTRFVRRLRRAR